MATAIRSKAAPQEGWSTRTSTDDEAHHHQLLARRRELYYGSSCLRLAQTQADISRTRAQKTDHLRRCALVEPNHRQIRIAQPPARLHDVNPLDLEVEQHSIQHKASRQSATAPHHSRRRSHGRTPMHVLTATTLRGQAHRKEAIRLAAARCLVQGAPTITHGQKACCCALRQVVHAGFEAAGSRQSSTPRCT